MDEEYRECLAIEQYVRGELKEEEVKKVLKEEPSKLRWLENAKAIKENIEKEPEKASWDL